jgi:capsular polysaccharide biosynthesis protein
VSAGLVSTGLDGTGLDGTGLDVLAPSGGWMPRHPQAAWAAGARLAGEVAASTGHGAPPNGHGPDGHGPDGHGPDGSVDALARASLPVLRELGVDAGVVRSRSNCLVVRSVPAAGDDAACTCAFVNGWLESLPALAGVARGAVVESTCVARGGAACLYALMWQPSPPADPTVADPPPRPALPRHRTLLPSPRPVSPPVPAGPGAAAPASWPTFERPDNRPAGRVARSGPADRSPDRPPSRRWAWARRRGWMVVLGLVAGAAGGYVAGAHHTTSYRATATLVVQSGASVAGPGSANDAQTLAVTYAALLPRDQAVVDRVASDLGVPASTVSRSLGVQAESGTALLQVKYTAPTAARAVAGADAVARAVSSLEPTGRAIAGGSVAVVSVAGTASPSDPLYHYALPLGAILGLFVGAGMVLVAERVDRRVDDPETLGEAASTHASPRPGGLSATELARALDGEVGSGPVAVVPMRPAEASAANHLADELTAAWPDGQAGPPVTAGLPFAVAPDAVDSAAATVLVVGAGERHRAVVEAADRLRLQRRGPVWSVLVARRRRR